MSETYTLKNGFTLTDENDVGIFLKLLNLQPHFNINFLHNDIGLGNLFAECFRHQQRFCVDNQKWYLYDNGVWKIDKGDIMSQGNMQKLLQLLHLYCKEVETEDNQEFIKEYRKYINKSSSDTILRRALNASKNSLVISIVDFDANPYLLNTTNGVYDLKTSSFRFATPEDYFTLSTSCPYQLPVNNHRCDRWYTFVDEIMDGDKEKADFLQKALGYSILGVNLNECMFIPYGATTRNGKGTLFNSIMRMLGSYGGTINSSLICESKFKDKDYNAPEPMLADTVGVRYLTLSETREDAVLDTNTIKSLTGRDPRKTRQLNCPAFTFVPQFTMWLSTNHLPRVNDDSIFKSDRVWVIEFNKHFDENLRDETLKDLFEQKENQSIILKWLIEGYNKYVREGLNPPECVREATERYARMNDRIRCFKEDCLEDAPGERVSRKLMYTAYKRWCADDERKFAPFGTTTFYKKLNRFYPSYERAGGDRGFENVKLRNSIGEIKL